MGVNKVEFNDEVLIDLTEDTVTKDDVLSGKTFHDKKGNVVTGVLVKNKHKPVIVIVDHNNRMSEFNNYDNYLVLYNPLLYSPGETRIQFGDIWFRRFSDEPLKVYISYKSDTSNMKLLATLPSLNTEEYISFLKILQINTNTIAVVCNWTTAVGETTTKFSPTYLYYVSVNSDDSIYLSPSRALFGASIYPNLTTIAGSAYSARIFPTEFPMNEKTQLGITYCRSHITAAGVETSKVAYIGYLTRFNSVTASRLTQVTAATSGLTQVGSCVVSTGADINWLPSLFNGNALESVTSAKVSTYKNYISRLNTAANSGAIAFVQTKQFIDGDFDSNKSFIIGRLNNGLYVLGNLDKRKKLYFAEINIASADNISTYKIVGEIDTPFLTYGIEIAFYRAKYVPWINILPGNILVFSSQVFQIIYRSNYDIELIDLTYEDEVLTWDRPITSNITTEQYSWNLFSPKGRYFDGFYGITSDFAEE